MTFPFWTNDRSLLSSRHAAEIPPQNGKDLHARNCSPHVRLALLHFFSISVSGKNIKRGIHFFGTCPNFDEQIKFNSTAQKCRSLGKSPKEFAVNIHWEGGKGFQQHHACCCSSLSALSRGVEWWYAVQKLPFDQKPYYLDPGGI